VCIELLFESIQHACAYLSISLPPFASSFVSRSIPTYIFKHLSLVGMVCMSSLIHVSDCVMTGRRVTLSHALHPSHHGTCHLSHHHMP